VQCAGGLDGKVISGQTNQVQAQAMHAFGTSSILKAGGWHTVLVVLNVSALPRR